MRATRPLFRFDPGWLFVLTGLAVCAAGVLLPAQADLRALEEQLGQLHAEEARAYQRLAAHADFIDQVDRSEPAMIRRLASAQLNLVPEGDKPVLLAGANGAPVTEWIDNTLDTDIRPPELEPVSTLSKWASGPSRLWMFGGGMMAVFIGLLISPETSRRPRRGAKAPVASGARGGTITAAADWHEVEDDRLAFMAHAAAANYRSGDVAESLPATVDVDDLGELVVLEQQEDTVDLEEDELPVRSRTIIDDDEAWHNAATIEHASEVVVEARTADATYDDTLLWGERVEMIQQPEAAAVDDETLSAEVAGEIANDNDAGPWLFEDEAARLDESSMLTSDKSQRAAAQANEDQPDGTEHAGPDAPAMPAKRGKPSASRSASKARTPRMATPKNDSVADLAAAVPEERDDDEPRSMRLRRNRPAKRLVERKPKPGPKRGSDDRRDSAAAIPFLRYRADMDDDGDEADGRDADETKSSTDEAMPTMSIDADAPESDDDMPAAAADLDMGEDDPGDDE